MERFINTRPEDVGLSAPRLERLEAVIESYVTERKIAGAATLIARRGEVAHFTGYGVMDLESGRPMRPDAIFRIFSMTKPLTSVAAMMLYEEGAFLLDDPVARFIPSFDKVQVFVSGDADDFLVRPPARAITIRDLLTHTSGLTYGFMNATPVDAMYRARKMMGPDSTHTLEEMVEKAASTPLLCDPGSAWNYSISTDVLGRIVEIVSGERLDDFFETRLLRPLEMNDTGFQVPEAKLDRFTSSYGLDDAGEFRVIDAPESSLYVPPRNYLSGGGGLVSTTQDYLQFARMMLNRGTLNGTRFLSPKTVDFMTCNHLPNGADLDHFGNSPFSETRYAGVGFGLGVSVIIDPTKTQTLCSQGDYGWGGAAGTYFWVDPKEDMIVIFMMQMQPSTLYPIRHELKIMANQSIID